MFKVYCPCTWKVTGITVSQKHKKEEKKLTDDEQFIFASFH